MKQTKIEKIEDMNLKLKIKVKCAVGEEQEVKTRLLNMIISHIKSMEGLFTTSWLPWSKSYYFSVREVIIV